jgi:hypothetical protein
LFESILITNQLLELDSEAIKRYNHARKSDKFKLHTELGPSPFEGNIATAPIVLLLANPGFDNFSTLDDHKFSRDGWPLGGLHPDAPSGLSSWWPKRLKQLTDTFGVQFVSKNIASLQLTPWASNRFDNSLRLPSRKLMLDLATQVANRGALMLVMRSEKLWLESEGVKTSQNRFRANSWLCSHVSKGNFDNVSWSKINDALMNA